MKCLALSMLLCATAALAKPADTTLAGWRGALANDPAINLPVLVVVKPTAQALEVVAVSAADAFETATGFKLKTAAEVDWKKKLNGGEPKLSDSLAEAAAQLQADYIVLMRPKGAWQLATTKTVIDVPPPKKPLTIPAEWGAWLKTVLGYDAVVVAVDADYLLVRGTAINFDKSIYGLAISNSAAALTLPTVQRQGAGMIKQVENDGHFAVFRVHLGEKDAIVPGTKILLQ